ncbi:MAG TPA: sigma-54 dependent transcriptional regulator [Alphaproteobacteria bacterium]|nr:sigma-54 dependent transcriptional regulator [Alphaproteobacteria bacterium]
MRQIGGLDILHEAHAIDPAIAVIMMVGVGSIPSAAEAIKHGAYHYLCKPIDVCELKQIVQQAVARQGRSAQGSRPHHQPSSVQGLDNIIGTSPAMRRIYHTIRQVAPSAQTILLRGESGTGKELIARALYRHSPRRHKPFLALNCTAFPEGLLESELFGYERGAFTGAQARKQGLFELADGGILFLDEIGDMSLATQAKLLRVLETKEFLRLGGTRLVTVDLGIIAATNADLEEAVQRRTFRLDLYHRLRVVMIEVPPLRQRLEDIPLLVQAFFEEFRRQHRKTVTGLSASAMRRLLRYSWPGNVRELRNCIESLVLLARGPIVDVNDLPPYLHADPIATEVSFRVGTSLREVEKEVIRQTVAHAKTKTEAAKLLRIGLRTLQRKVKTYGLN